MKYIGLSFFMVVILIAIFSSCNDDVLETTIIEKVAIQGYLHTDQPLENIKLTKVLTPADESIQPINDAIITIAVDGQTFGLTSVGAGLYHEPNLVVETGKMYQISFDYFGKRISSSTIVPTKPENINISDSLIYLEQITDFSGIGGTQPDPIQVTWNNPNGYYFYVVMDNMETTLEYVNLLFAPQSSEPYHFASTPEVVDIFSINPRRNLQQYGTYRIIIYQVNPEYAALFNDAGNTSLTINEPPTNVENGVGIFTGVNSDTLYLEVKKQ